MNKTLEWVLSAELPQGGISAARLRSSNACPVGWNHLSGLVLRLAGNESFSNAWPNPFDMRNWDVSLFIYYTSLPNWEDALLEKSLIKTVI